MFRKSLIWTTATWDIWWLQKTLEAGCTIYSDKSHTTATAPRPPPRAPLPSVPFLNTLYGGLNHYSPQSTSANKKRPGKRVQYKLRRSLLARAIRWWPNGQANIDARRSIAVVAGLSPTGTRADRRKIWLAAAWVRKAPLGERVHHIAGLIPVLFTCKSKEPR